MLLRELRGAVFETPDSFTVTDAAGKQVAGTFGQSVRLPAGKYRLRTAYAGQTFEEPLWINPGTTTAVTFEAINVSAAPVAPATPAVPPAVPAAGAGAPPAKSVPGTPAKFCTNCGAALKPGAKFCTQCGTRSGN